MDDLKIYDEIENVIEEQIENYKEIEKLYITKQNILKRGSAQELFDIDYEIVDKYEKAKRVEIKRKTFFSVLGGENINLSEVIEMAKEDNSEKVPRLIEQKTQLNSLFEQIKHQEIINLELIKRGKQLVDKHIKIILDFVSPNTKEYDMNGKAQKNDINICKIDESC